MRCSSVAEKQSRTSTFLSLNDDPASSCECRRPTVRSSDHPLQCRRPCQRRQLPTSKQKGCHVRHAASHNTEQPNAVRNSSANGKDHDLLVILPCPERLSDREQE